MLPSLALALPIAASLERLQSRAMAEALADPSILAALARGIPRRRVVWRHAFRLSLKPVLAIYGIIVASALSGSFAVEIVMSWPGLGDLMYEAPKARDVFLVAGCAATGSFFLATGLLASDLALAAIDPASRANADDVASDRLAPSSLVLIALIALSADALAPNDPAPIPRPNSAADAPRHRRRRVCTGRLRIPFGSSIGWSGVTSGPQPPHPSRFARGCARPTTAPAPGSCSGATRSGAMSSRGFSKAPGCRSAWPSSPRPARSASARSSVRSPDLRAAGSTSC